MISRGVIINDDHFDRNQVLTTTPGANGWTLVKVAAGGSPTAQTITQAGGAIALTLAATSEAESLAMTQGDVLTLGASLLQAVDFEISVAAIDNVTTAVWGIGTAQNAAPGSVTNAAFFRILGSGSLGNVLIDTRDGTNTNASIATGVSLSSTPMKFTIDFTQGLADVRFFIDSARVAAGTTFNMSGLSASQCLQPIVQLQKASGTGVAALTCYRVRTQSRFAYGL